MIDLARWGEGLQFEKVGDACQKICIKPPKETNMGVAQAFLIHKRCHKTELAQSPAHGCAGNQPALVDPADLKTETRPCFLILRVYLLDTLTDKDRGVS